MNGDFIYNPFWQALGAFFFVVAIIFCSYQLIKNKEDVIDDEPEKEASSYNRCEARITTAVK